MTRPLEQAARRDHVFRTVTEKINAGVQLEDIANHVYESFRELIPYDRVGVALLEQANQVLCARWARAEYECTRIGQGFSARMQGSSLARILETREPRIINDLEAHFATHTHSESTALILSEGVRSPGECLDALQQRADRALYAAKRRGRNRVVASSAPASESEDPSSDASACGRQSCGGWRCGPAAFRVIAWSSNSPPEASPATRGRDLPRTRTESP